MTPSRTPTQYTIWAFRRTPKAFVLSENTELERVRWSILQRELDVVRLFFSKNWGGIQIKMWKARENIWRWLNESSSFWWWQSLIFAIVLNIFVFPIGWWGALQSHPPVASSSSSSISSFHVLCQMPSHFTLSAVNSHCSAKCVGWLLSSFFHEKTNEKTAESFS